jgi:hypothetical protein
LRHLNRLLNSLVPIAGDDVGGPKLARQSQTLGLMAQHYDLFGAQAAGRQRGAQAHRPISDDRHTSTRSDVGTYRCVMARCHDIGQGQNGLEQGLISLHLGRYNDQGGIGKARPNSLSLPAFVSKAPETTLHTGAIESLEAELTGSITEVIGGNYAVPTFDSADLRADILHNAHPFVTDLPAWLVGSLTAIGPEIGATDTGMSNLHHGVGWLKKSCIGDLLYLDSKGSAKNGCSHRWFLFLLFSIS